MHKHYLSLILALSLITPVAARAVTYGATSVQISPTTSSVSGPTAVTVYGGVGETFMLDATQSTDDGAVQQFLWRQTSGPLIKIVNSTTPHASVVPSLAGTYVFELTVTDAVGRSSVTQKSSFIVGNNAPETTSAATSPSAGAGGISSPSSPPQEAGGDVFIKIDTIKGESSEKKKGNVEINWKVEEGESAPAIEPDEIDVADDGEPLTPDFGVLLGGGLDLDDDGDLINTKTEDGRRAMGTLLLEGALELDAPVESVVVKTNKIESFTIKQNVKLFRLFSVQMAPRVDINAESAVSVHYPWWAFLASGKEDKELLGLKVYESISNVLKTKHDTVKNSIGNIR